VEGERTELSGKVANRKEEHPCSVINRCEITTAIGCPQQKSGFFSWSRGDITVITGPAGEQGTSKK
jgi:hypothetical protein